MAWGGGALTTEMLAEYNHHIFNETTETTELRVTPVYDQAGRTVIYSVYSITLREYLTGVTTTDDQVRAAVANLTKPAGVFRYKGRGFGDLEINIGPKWDVVWGPKPRVVGLKPVGASKTVELTWTVEVAIPTCSDAIFKFEAMEFNFKVQFDRDRHGYTTRVYSGFIRIPQTRTDVAARKLTETADQYLEDIYPPLLPGFRRIPGTAVISEDKCRLDFTITDEQMPPNAPPPGIVLVESDQTFNSGSGNLAHWSSTISATYDIDRANGNPAQAVEAFLALVQDRKLRAREMRMGRGLENIGVKLGGGLAAKLGKPVCLIPYAASASEPNIYGRTQVKLSVTFTVAGIGFTEVFARGGLWQPIPKKAGGDWKAWSMSLKNTLSARGHAELRFRPNEDALVDLCGKVRTLGPSNNPPAVGQGTNQARAGSATDAILLNALLSDVDVPDPDNSWLCYRCTAILHPETGRVPITTLPSAPLTSSQNQGNALAWDPLLGQLPGISQASSPFPPLTGLLSADQTGGQTVVHQRTRPTFYVTLQGQALRAGYPIPVPELAQVNGTPPTLVGQPYFAQGVVANASVPIVRADFSMTYLFTDDLGGAPVGSFPVPRQLA